MGDGSNNQAGEVVRLLLVIVGDGVNVWVLVDPSALPKNAR